MERFIFIFLTKLIGQFFLLQNQPPGLTYMPLHHVNTLGSHGHHGGLQKVKNSKNIFSLGYAWREEFFFFAKML